MYWGYSGGAYNYNKVCQPFKAWIYCYRSAEDRGRGLSVLGCYWLAHGIFSLFRQSYTPIRLLGGGRICKFALDYCNGKMGNVRWGICDDTREHYDDRKGPIDFIIVATIPFVGQIRYNAYVIDLNSCAQRGRTFVLSPSNASLKAQIE